MQTRRIVAWTEKYRPTTPAMLLGNEEGVETFKAWLKQWTLKKKSAKACLLVGPPGVGKTSLARGSANDLHFRIVEMNASDVRTEKSIRKMLTPAGTSATLDSYTGSTRGNLILMDEVDGVFGREDRGGLAAILTMIKAPVPIVMTANNVDDERFDDLKKACVQVELVEIRPRLLVSLISYILAQEGRSVPEEVVKQIARRSHGDIRAAVNDIQTIATSGSVNAQPYRTRELDEAQTLKALFESRGISEARRVLSQTEVPLYRDELLLLMHDVLPYVYSSASKLSQAYDALSRADMGYGRIGASRSRGMMPPPFNLPRRDLVPEWSLLPVALNELAAVGTQEVDNDLDHAIEVAPRISRKVVDRFQYRLWALDHLCGRVARMCHISKRKALHEIIPFLIAIFRADEDRGREIAMTLELEERDIDFLNSESKIQTPVSGDQEILDPTGFKLPYMGKDKFVQLMRAGISYERNSGKFAVRRLSELDAVEERLFEVLSRPVCFKRPDQIAKEEQGKIVKECYVDEREVSCNECEFIEDCPTHVIGSRKFCLCDETLSDREGYAKYVAKNTTISKPTKFAAKVPRRKKT